MIEIFFFTLFSLVFSFNFLFYAECDRKPPCQRRRVHRGPAAGPDRSLHVRPSGHGHFGWGEGALQRHTQASCLLIAQHVVAFRAQCEMLLHRWTCTSWRSPLQASGCTTTQRWLTAAAVCLLSSRTTSGLASECILSKWWSGEKKQQRQKAVLRSCVKYWSRNFETLTRSSAKIKQC